MKSKNCTKCNYEKIIEDFRNKYTECEDSKSKRSLNRYYDNKDKTSKQPKIYYEKNR